LIVEGIETDSELSVLRELAIELGQGYLLGRPLPLATETGTGVTFGTSTEQRQA
jgi:EAL domain-containing protein (putative c-di-GMP-specific phosphodiesterase class I)